MTTLIIGTGGSGKSAFAEDLAVKTRDPVRYYLATMQVTDAAGMERVRKHRRLREGKGFITIERTYDITGAFSQMRHAAESTVLLECMANLVGNEMHRAGCLSRERFADAVMSDIRYLAERVSNLIIVTDEYRKDGEGYDASTRLYVRLLDLVNERLLEYADVVFDRRYGKDADR